MNLADFCELEYYAFFELDPLARAFLKFTLADLNIHGISTIDNNNRTNFKFMEG